MAQKERRRFKRVPIELIITCYLPTPEEGSRNQFQSYAKDISPKGIKLIASHRARIGDEIILVLEKPVAIMPILAPILVKGKIRWIKKLDEPPQEGEEAMQIGIEFLHVSSYGSKKLDSLMKEVEAQNRLNAGV